MTDFKNQWNLEMALDVLQNEMVDSGTWSDAVKWLLLYGPPEIKELLHQASSHATGESFPGLLPNGYDKNGQPCYELKELARALGMTEEEVLEKMVAVEIETGEPQFRDPSDVHKVN